MPGVFEQMYVKRLEADYFKPETSKYDQYMALRCDIRNFKEKNNCDRLVMIWCASTEVFIPMNGIHDTASHFEKALRENQRRHFPSMLYCYAALSEDVPYINGSPSLSVDIPYFIQLAKERHIPIAGNDFKTGQTLMKTVLAPILKTKALGFRAGFRATYSATATAKYSTTGIVQDKGG
jgi:myo-inositol-1-phosphate synthase